MIVFAHVTDVHFGGSIVPWGGVPLQQPHDAVKCERLPDDLRFAYADVAASGEALRVVVTGDLTVSGTPAQFAVAQSFFRSNARLSRTRTRPFGLALDRDHLATIPGNHDHWDGNRSNTTPYNALLFPGQFRRTPWVKTWSSSQHAFELDLFGVDSSSGLAGTVGGRARGFWAQGAISNREFTALESKLVASRSKTGRRVRAILCHHSPSYRNGLAGKGELDAASADRLRQLCAKHRVAVVLTGHTHDFHHEPPPPAGGFHELRCAASLCKEKGGGLLVHRLGMDAAGDIFWECFRYPWTGSRFDPVHPSPWRSFSV